MLELHSVECDIKMVLSFTSFVVVSCSDGINYEMWSMLYSGINRH